MSSEHIYNLANVNKNLSLLFGIQYTEIEDTGHKIPWVNEAQGRKRVLDGKYNNEVYVQSLLEPHKNLIARSYYKNSKKSFVVSITEIETSIEEINNHITALLYNKTQIAQYITYVRNFRQVKTLLIKRKAKLLTGNKSTT